MAWNPQDDGWMLVGGRNQRHGFCNFHFGARWLEVTTPRERERPGGCRLLNLAIGPALFVREVGLKRRQKTNGHKSCPALNARDRTRAMDRSASKDFCGQAGEGRRWRRGQGRRWTGQHRTTRRDLSHATTNSHPSP